ncbi:unnamed protein product [Phytophthora fragariaefolia]|uniref:Unnamed protein product n=1 Tax=Phytophthora fragariaefolia TaxID=1490495 RepID=A0A9W6XMZ1_9STRA|nr:unnamed protein product [Phytophthora fragariaefolia]
METRQDSALEKLNARLDLEVARRFGPRAQGASEKREDAPPQTDNARVHRETETQEAARLEAVRLVRERADALLAQYRAQTEAHQAEEARRVTTMVESMQKALEHMRVERAREPDTAKNVQTFLRGQLRNIRMTSVQTTPRPVTSQPDLATSRPNLYPEFSGVINDDRKAATEAGTRLGAQPDAAKRARPANAKSAERKGRDASSQNNKSKRTPKCRGSSDNSDSDSSSGSSDQDSDHSDSSSFEDVVPNIPTVTGPDGTMFTFRPYVNASALADFDEKASLAVRTRWLERFQSIAVQGGWTDKVKIYEMKLKLSAAVRNWRANLSPKVRRDWMKFLKAFREMYCKAKTSDSERNYTMMQRKSEWSLEFYYRMNKVADKPGIDFDTSSKQRERHLKVFMKKLLDSRLRSTLQGRMLRDLEYVLKQHEEMTQGGDYVGPPPKRDFRADNVSHGRFQPKRSGRAYVIQDEDSPDEDEDDREGVPSLEVILEKMEAKHKTSQVPSSESSRTPDGVLLRMESFDQRPDHPVSKSEIAPSSVNAAMILDIPPRAVGPTSSVIAVAARGTLLGCVECDLARSVRSFMKTNVENGKKNPSSEDTRSSSPLDGGPERVGLKTTPELCGLVYVGPELRSKSQDNHQCMTVISENEEYLSDLPLPDQLRLEEDCPDNNDRDDPPEFQLGPGQQYGW